MHKMYVKKNGNLFSNVSQESASNDHLKFKYSSLNSVTCRFQKSVPKLMQFFLHPVTKIWSEWVCLHDNDVFQQQQISNECKI